MRTRRVVFISVFIIAAVAIVLGSGLTGFLAADAHKVARVIDGDTLVLDDGRHVRLLGVDTPEKGQKYWLDAKAFLESKTLNAAVRLESDVEDKDKYGRLLRWVFAGDELVNLGLVQGGYAKTLFYEDVRYKDVLLGAEQTAKASGLRVWGVVGNPDAFCLGVYYLRYNAPGDDKKNLSGEFVELRNACAHALDMDGWRLQDNSSKAYVFRGFTLKEKSIVTLHTGSGVDNATDLFWNLSSPLWNNSGDRLRVWDANGQQVLDYDY